MDDDFFCLLHGLVHACIGCEERVRSSAVATRPYSEICVVGLVNLFALGDPNHGSNESEAVGLDDGSNCPLDLSLKQIFQFDKRMRWLARKHAGLKMICCLHTEPNQQAVLLYLLGCHLIMSYGLTFEETLIALRPTRGRIAGARPEIFPRLESALRAVCCAKCLDWIDFSAQDNAAELQMDEYSHYAR